MRLLWPTQGLYWRFNFGIRLEYAGFPVFLTRYYAIKMKKLLFVFGTLVLGLSACTKDGSDSDGDNTTNLPGQRTALIGIEGTSPNGISSLASYNITNQQVENNLYRKANINPMGAQMSDMMIDAENRILSFVLPGSDKVLFADLDDYKLIGSTTGLLRINNIAKTAANRYYVSSAEIEGVYIVNPLNQNLVEEFVFYGTNPTAITVHEDLAFVAITGDPIVMDSTVAIIRTGVDTLITKLNVGRFPNSFVIDNNNNMYILCAGDYNAANPAMSGIGSLWKYNLDTMQMAIDSNFVISPDTVLYFTDNQLKPHSLAFDPNGNSLYYVGNSPTGNIYSMSANSNRVSENPLVSGNFYNIAFDGVDQELYGLRTPNDINMDGDLQVFDPVGSLKTSIRVGVKPRDVAFK